MKQGNQIGKLVFKVADVVVTRCVYSRCKTKSTLEMFMERELIVCLLDV